MTVWELSFTIEQFALDAAILGVLFLLGTLGRRYVGLFQRFLIPVSLIAGFLGLLLGPEVFGVLDFSVERMGVYVYHLLTLTFIGVGLYHLPGTRTRGALHFGFMQIVCFLVQVLVGLGIALAVVYFIDPEFVPAVGTLVPLGLGMGPGIAYSIGQSWEAFGFPEGGSIGLTMAALGFLVAYGAGVVIVNRGIRAGRAVLVTEIASLDADVRTGLVKTSEPLVGARLTLSPGAIEPLTFHLALIGGVYLGSYALLRGAAWGLTVIGLEREIVTLWSFHFVFANLLALVLRRLMDRLAIGYLIDNGLLHRTTGLFADVLIAASIMAISLIVTRAYLVPVLVMGAVGSVVTYYVLKWTSRVFTDYPFERFVGIFGQMTGTISSGLALVRVTDPEYTTSVAQDLVLGSGMALVLGFPLLLAINLPFTVFDGRLEGYWAVIGLSTVYLVLMLASWTRFGLGRRKSAVH